MKTDPKELVELALQGSKKERDERVDRIRKWLDIYNGAPYGNEDAGRSQMVWKICMKHLEALVPNVAKPFVSSYNLIDLSPLTKNDYHKAKIYEHLGNHFFAKEFNRDKFIKTIIKVAGKEGTAYIRVGWDNDTKVKKTIEEYMTPQIQQKLEEDGAIVTQLDNGKWEIKKERILTNRPTAKVIKAENIYKDPTADTFEECKFIIHEYITDLSELKRQSHLYNEEAIKQVEELLEKDRLDDNADQGEIREQNPDRFEFTEKTSKKFRLYEYFGEYDIDNDGVNEQVVIVIAKSETNDNDSVLMRIEENPFPFKKPPFVAIPLFDNEFSTDGLPLAHFLGDEQMLMTSIIRSVIDNMSGSNSGVKFVRKKALDQTNYNRLINREPVVEINTNEPINAVMQDGNFNELPQSVYNLFSMVDQHAESLSGVSKMMQAMVSSEMQSSTSNFNTMMSQSQIRLMDITNNLNIGLKQIIYMWIEMCMAYLSNDEIQRITGINIDQLKVRETNRLVKEFGLEELPPDVQQKAMMLVMNEVDDMFKTTDFKFDVDIKVGTDGSRDIKIGQLNMFLQQAAGLSQSGVVPPAVIKLLVAEFAELLEKPEIADMIKNYQPAPDPTQQAMAENEIMQGRANAAKDDALAKNAIARTNLTEAKAQEAMASIEANVANKYADVYQKTKEEEQVNDGK